MAVICPIFRQNFVTVAIIFSFLFRCIKLDVLKRFHGVKETSSTMIYDTA